MKVSIITWYHYHNLGTALQVKALITKIEKLGYNSYVVDYIPKGSCGACLPNMRVSKVISKIIKRVQACFLKSDLTLYQDSLRSEKYERFVENFPLTKKCVTMSDLQTLNSEYDAFVCGSDQIWTPHVFNPHYFLDFVSDDKRKIAYAPSVGLNKIENVHIKAQMKDLCQKIPYLSTREKSGSKLIENLLDGRNVDTVLDPTLLLDKQDWEQIADNNEIYSDNYLLAYFLGCNEKYWENVYQIAKELNLKVKIIPIYKKDSERHGEILQGVGPKEFLSLIRNAQYVCTDSFHGLIFSINFEKQFTAYERFKRNDKLNQNSRIHNILNLLELQSRIYSRGKQSEKYRDEIDYIKVKKKLKQEVIHSEGYLKRALKNVQAYNEKKTKDKNNIKTYNHLCSGCGVCATICPTSAIEISENSEGFFQAIIHEDKCVSCGKCKNVCAFMNCQKGTSIEKAELYSYKDNSIEILKNSSSGGFAYRLAQFLNDKSYSIVGCAFDINDKKAKHIVIPPKNEQSLYQLSGSKYIQSSFADAIKEVYGLKTPVLIIGTPCQIASAKRLLIDRDNIVYVDLICHGVPSYLIYSKYIQKMIKENDLNRQAVTTVFRDKENGWKTKFITLYDGVKRISHYEKEDYFYRLFERMFGYMDSCYDCNWRETSEADIRIGDYWGDKFKEDKTGVSMVIAMSEKGKVLIESLKQLDIAKIEKQDTNDYFRWQQSKNIAKPVFHIELLKDLSSEEYSIEKIDRKYIRPYERAQSIKRIYSRIVDVMRKLVKLTLER